MSEEDLSEYDVVIFNGRIKITVGVYTVKAEREGVLLFSASLAEITDGYISSGWKDFYKYTEDFIVKKLQFIL